MVVCLEAGMVGWVGLVGKVGMIFGLNQILVNALVDRLDQKPDQTSRLTPGIVLNVKLTKNIWMTRVFIGITRVFTGSL